MGLTETGGKCCDYAVPPTCFLAPNDMDKGGKSGPAIAISKEGHKLMSAFLAVRNQYCLQLTGSNSASTSGQEPFFPDSKGKLDPKKLFQVFASYVIEKLCWKFYGGACNKITLQIGVREYLITLSHVTYIFKYI